MARARIFWTGLVASLALICGSQPLEAWAQRSGSGGGGRNTSSGTFGSRSLGSGVSGGNRSFGGGRSGGGGGGQGGIAQLGGGGGAGGGVAGRTTRGDSSIGALDGNERFSRGRQPGQFVGGDANDTTNFMSAMALGSAMSRGNRGNRGGGGNNRNNANNRGSNNRGDSRPALPVRRIVAFDVPVANSGAISTALSGRLNRSLRTPDSQIAVSLEGRTAVLSGVVATDHDRDLAARMVLLEPGVDAVDNSLTVAELLPSP